MTTDLATSISVNNNFFGLYKQYKHNFDCVVVTHDACQREQH